MERHSSSLYFLSPWFSYALCLLNFHNNILHSGFFTLLPWCSIETLKVKFWFVNRYGRPEILTRKVLNEKYKYRLANREAVIIFINQSFTLFTNFSTELKKLIGVMIWNKIYETSFADNGTFNFNLRRKSRFNLRR